MILTGREVEWYIKVGKLKIVPLEEYQIQQNGVDMILEETEKYNEVFSPGEFRLGCTRERIEMPDDLMAFVQLRSTWARKGWMLPPTVVDAGFKGNLTLEIVSFCRNEVPIGQRFAHLIFAKLTGPTVPYTGRYQGQSGITLGKAERDEWIEREAAVCPEDIGFDEYIKILTKQRDGLRQELAEAHSHVLDVHKPEPHPRAVAALRSHYEAAIANWNIALRERDLARAKCAEAVSILEDITLHTNLKDWKWLEEHEHLYQNARAQSFHLVALDKLRAAWERLHRAEALIGWLREQADAAIPTDRAIGYTICADKLEQALVTCKSEAKHG